MIQNISNASQPAPAAGAAQPGSAAKVPNPTPFGDLLVDQLAGPDLHALVASSGYVTYSGSPVVPGNAASGPAPAASAAPAAPAAPALSDQPPPPLSAPTPIPVPEITNVRDRDQVEAHMNAWLENVTQNANYQKMQIYQQAMTDWKLNAQQCQAYGLAAPPQPLAPTLDPVQAMPSGWWFQS